MASLRVITAERGSLQHTSLMDLSYTAPPSRPVGKRITRVPEKPSNSHADSSFTRSKKNATRTGMNRRRRVLLETTVRL